jgi:hypothetical protein
VRARAGRASLAAWRERGTGELGRASFLAQWTGELS